MIADVKRDGVIRGSMNKDPNIGTINELDFNVQSIIQDYLNEDLETITSNDIISFTNAEVLVELDFYEVTKPVDVLVTAWLEGGLGTPDLTSPSTISINATLQHNEDQDLDRFTIDDTTKLFLTNAPLVQKIQRTETIQLHFLTNETTVKYKFRQFDSNNNLLASTAVPAIAHTVTNKAGIITLDGSGLLANATYLTIILSTGSLITDISAEMRFNIDDVCYTDQVRLNWLNPLGGIDAYTFKGQHAEEVRFRTKEYEKVLSKSFTQQDRGRTTLRTNGFDHLEVWSKAENRATIKHLSEIGLSSDVWIVESGFIPVTVSSRKAKTVNSISPEIQARFKLKHSNARITQRN